MKRSIILALSLLFGLSMVYAGTNALAAAAADEIPFYKMRFLGAEGAGSGLPDELPSVSDAGVVIGNFRTNNNRIRPWVQAPGEARTYLPLPPGIQNGEAADINGNDVIIGSVWNNPANKRLARWVPDVEGTYVAQSLCNNEVIEGVALNDSGVAVGHRTMTRVEDGRVIQMTDGVRFIPGVGCEALSQYGFDALPADINDEGDIVGGQYLLRGTTNFNIGMPPSFTDGAFQAVNNLGHIIGTATDGVKWVQFVNYDMDNWQLFGLPSDDASGIDLNDLGAGIGIGTLGPQGDAPMATCCYCLTCTVALGADAAYLDTLLLPSIQGLDLSGISDLNNANQIVGRASGPIFPGGWETVLLSPVEACAGNCLRSQNIFMTPYFAGGNRYAIGLVFVRNEGNQPVPNATVYASWQRPDGTLLHRTATTNGQGRALFFTPAPVDGTYGIYVTDIERPTLQFDPLASNALSDQLTVP